MRINKSLLLFCLLKVAIFSIMIYVYLCFIFKSLRVENTQNLENIYVGGYDPERQRNFEKKLFFHEEPVIIEKIDLNSSGLIIVRSKNDFNKLFINNNILKMIYDKNCPLKIKNLPQPDIQMLELYKKIKFENVNGGVWEQGFNITYDTKQWTPNQKLKVFVVPYSHNDPGWLYTFHDYYETRTKKIFENILFKLNGFPKRKFIWSEISFLSLWWKNTFEINQRTFKKFLENGQLEIVSGGWVMNDEAISHRDSILQQLTIGHQWLIRNLNYTPQSAWTIDPFGLSPVMAEMFRGAGLKNLVIQRVHYEVKKYLAARKQLEFRWKQLYDGTEKSSLLTHMMPFFSYDTKEGCGPDGEICTMFDFFNLDIQGDLISDDENFNIGSKNVAYLAELLLDQYRKKSQLYSTNCVLIPLGGDFRFYKSEEWDSQFNNYEKLFVYMNSKASWNVEVKFSTLTEYFDAVLMEQKMETFSILTGDFFTYADLDDDYWSGFYSTRPLYKRMERILLSYIKATDIILTLMQNFESLSPKSHLVLVMEEARKSLALFQHHDGITGTSQSHVVLDFAEKMWNAILQCRYLIQYAANIILSGTTLSQNEWGTMYYNMDEPIISIGSNPERLLVQFDNDIPIRRIILFNPLTFTRREVIKLTVSSQFVQVKDPTGAIIECQISPIFEKNNIISYSQFELAFISDIPSFGLITYRIYFFTSKEKPPAINLASVRLLNFARSEKNFHGFNVKITSTPEEFSIRNHRIIANFSSTGLLKTIRIGNETVPINLNFATYHGKSGAYVFSPNGEAKIINPYKFSTITIIEGPIYSSMTVPLPHVLHSVILYNSPGADGLGLQIQNLVDIYDTHNYEIIMRLSTEVKSGEDFFTDLNGHQIIRRKRFKKLPIQGNYYPMPTTTYIEDKKYRLTVLTGAPLGCSSLKEGQLEIMMDRHLEQPDSKGLSGGIKDLHPVQHIFNIVLEKRKKNCQIVAENHPSGFHTISSHLSSQTLLNPIIKLIEAKESKYVFYSHYLESKNLGIDFTIVSLRSSVFSQMTEDNIGLVINRQYLDTCFQDGHLSNEFTLSSGTVNLSAILPFARKAWKSSLTFLYLGDEIGVNEPLSICPMSTEAFIINK